MSWVVFSYSISRPSRSSPRVAIWRRLQRVGAVSPLNGMYILPARPECLEAFQWLAQEIRSSKGNALVMQTEHLEGKNDAQLVALFNDARGEDYEQVARELAELERLKDPVALREGLEKARRRHAEIARIDFFGSPEGARVAQHLARLAARLAPRAPSPDLPTARISDYRGKTWVTRPRPYVDRLACGWLVHRFIDPNATIRYSLTPRPGEVAFDMEEGGEFGHVGNLCTFETMCLAFGLDDPGLRAVADIVHQIDLNDGQYARAEAAGVDSVLDGWHKAELADAELEARGMTLFEGLYVHLARSAMEQTRPRARSKGMKSRGGKR